MNCFLIHVYLLVSLKFSCLLPNLASQRPVLRGNTSRASFLQTKHSCHLCPPYLPMRGISPPLQVNFHVLPLKPSNCFSFCDNVFSSWGVKSWDCCLPYYWSSRLASFILLVILIFQKSWFDHYFQKGKKFKKRKGTPPRYVNVWSAPVDSVSHGLWKQRMGGVSQFYKSKNEKRLRPNISEPL